MPKLWIGDKMYFVDDDEVRDYCEKLEERIKELEAENVNWKQRYIEAVNDLKQALKGE